MTGHVDSDESVLINMVLIKKKRAKKITSLN